MLLNNSVSNFDNRLKYDMTHCAFNNIMSDMETIPFFGTSFSVYAPLLILAVVIFTLCDFYPRILRFLGIEHEDALLIGDEDELDGKVNEGIQLTSELDGKVNEEPLHSLFSLRPAKVNVLQCGY